MTTSLQTSYEFHGKKYNLLSSEFHEAFAEAGIYTFRYYPQEKTMLCSDFFMKRFNAERFYENLPESLIGKLFKQENIRNLHNITDSIDAGQKKVTEIIPGQSGNSILITLSAIEFDSDGKILVCAGIVEDIEETIRANKIIDALSDDYGCIYYVDCANNKIFPQRLSEEIEEEYGDILRKQPSLDFMTKLYIRNSVLEVEQEEMTKILSLENIENHFKTSKYLVHDFRVVRNGKVLYFRMKIVNFSKPGEFTSFIVAFSDISKLKIHELEKMAYVDPVTEGNNYNYFKKRVREISRPGYFVSMDIHQFKLINSICGVGYGDRVLRNIWKAIMDLIDEGEIPGHVNADHFVIYVPHMDKDIIIKKIGILTERLFKLSVEMRCPRLHPYFGIAQWDSRKRIEEAYSLTTIAKHDVKNNKEVNYLFYTKDESQKIIENKSMEDAFPEALANSSFEVWYQPKFNPVTNKMVGAEALVRWRLPDGKLMPPAKFIPVFEQNGLIRTLDEYVFDAVCHFIKDRLKNSLPVVPVSVNLSRASLCYDGIVQEYTNIVRDTGISPEYVPIEITESSAADNSEIKQITSDFRKNGFPLCMDDFGTGYSSLAMLNLLRFDNLKLDKSLIDSISEDSGHKLIKHIIALSKDLGMNITAEGVESEEQKDSLLKLNCDSIQGYYYHPPLPKEDFVKLF